MLRSPFFSALVLAGGAFASSGRLVLVGTGLAGIPDSTRAAVRDVLVQTLQEVHGGEVLDRADSSCLALGCGQRVLATESGDRGIWMSVSHLGSTYTLSASAFRGGDMSPTTQRLSVRMIDDLPNAADQVLRSVLEGKTLAEAGTIDNVSETESRNEPLRRKSLSMTGVTFGFLYPVGDESYARLETDYSYDASYNYTDTTRKFRQKQYLNLGAAYWYEFRENLALDAELKGSFPISVSGQINVIKYLSKGNVSPFLGGGLGVEWVFPDDDDPDTKMNAGPQLNAQAGLMLFRTYDVRAMVRGGYQATFNSDHDNGAFAELGLLYAPKERNASNGSSSGGSSWWKYLLGYMVVASLIGAAAD